MNETTEAKRKEIDRNFEAMLERLDEYMPLHAGKHALMRHGEVIDFYNDWQDAYRTGMRFYQDGLFSIQKVTKMPVDLGYFSHAVHLW